MQSNPSPSPQLQMAPSISTTQINFNIISEHNTKQLSLSQSKKFISSKLNQHKQQIIRKLSKKIYRCQSIKQIDNLIIETRSSLQMMEYQRKYECKCDCKCKETIQEIKDIYDRISDCIDCYEKLCDCYEKCNACGSCVLRGSLCPVLLTPAIILGIYCIPLYLYKTCSDNCEIKPYMQSYQSEEGRQLAVILDKLIDDFRQFRKQWGKGKKGKKNKEAK